MSKSGTGPDKRICYSGYKNERPVFDLSAVKPENERVIVFYVSGSYFHLIRFDCFTTDKYLWDIPSPNVFAMKVEVIISTNICRCMTVWRSASI